MPYHTVSYPILYHTYNIAEGKWYNINACHCLTLFAYTASILLLFLLLLFWMASLRIASHRLNADHSIFPFFILPCMLSLFLRLVLNCSSIYLFIIICMYHFSLVGQCYKVDTWLIQYVNLCEQNDVWTLGAWHTAHCIFAFNFVATRLVPTSMHLIHSVFSLEFSGCGTAIFFRTVHSIRNR